MTRGATMGANRRRIERELAAERRAREPPLKASVTLPWVRSTTGLHGACVRTSWASEPAILKSITPVMIIGRASCRFIGESPQNQGRPFELVLPSGC
jgi:hypothetical protein